ncbi:MAG: GcrA family cell cycle regulator [Bacteroidota bacterium]|jgi:hypothetical protein
MGVHLAKMEWTEELVAELRQLKASGLTQNAIARKLNTTPNVIAGKLFRLRERDGIKSTPRGPLNKPRAAAERQMPSMPKIPEAKSEPVKVLKYDGELITVGTGKPCTLVDLVGCKWPVGEVKGHFGRHIFCNQPRSRHLPYCEHHTKQAGDIYRGWTQQEDQQIRKEWKGGFGRDALAQRLKRTKQAVSLRAQQLGLAG